MIKYYIQDALLLIHQSQKIKINQKANRTQSLFQLLKPALLASSTPNFNSRVVNVSSSGHRALDLKESDNYNFQKGDYQHLMAYSNSKLANIYMANEIDRRYGNQGLHATSLHPGAIFTNIARHIGPEFVLQILNNEKVVKMRRSPEQGAATTVVAAVGKEWEGRGGKYLDNCELAKRGEDDYDLMGAGYVKQTYDPENEKRLWKDSLEIVGIKDDM